jgi:hypothetical protein
MKAIGALGRAMVKGEAAATVIDRKILTVQS